MADVGSPTAPVYLPVVMPYQGNAGTLLVLGQDGLPFPVRRMFWITGVPVSATRGDHAHKADTQIHVAVKGDWRFTIAAAPGEDRHLLLRTNESLLVPPTHWTEVRSCSQSGILVVLCALPYDESDYIRNRAEWEDLFTSEKA